MDFDLNSNVGRNVHKVRSPKNKRAQNENRILRHPPINPQWKHRNFSPHPAEAAGRYTGSL